jgi:endonuclease/exonuclease/phosphatase (EEP) superfamily protein YafD
VSVLRYVLLSANTALAVVFVLACVAPLVHPSTNWIPGILSLFFPYLFLLLSVFLVFWLLSSSRSWALLSLFALLFAAPHIPAYYGISSGPGLKLDEEALVMSFNIQEFQLVRGQTRQKTSTVFKEIASYIQKYGTPDLLCVQDYTKENEAFFSDFLKYKQRHVFGKHRVKTAIFSKTPIIKKGEIDFENSFSSCVWVDLKFGTDTIRVYSVHLESNQISKDTEEMLSQEEVSEEALRKKIRTMLRKYKRSAAARVDQASQITEHVKESPYPVVLCGDLNDIPLSMTYRKMKGRLNDSFRKKGRGFGATYAGGIPGLRIDYIFASESLDFLESNILSDQAFSDHYAVMARIRFNKVANE